MRKKNIIIGLCLFQFIIGCRKTEYDYEAIKKVDRDGKGVYWVFEGKYQPPINLKDSKEFLSDINKVLESLELPLVKTVVKEKSEITQRRVDRRLFEWENYEEGVLHIYRSVDKDANYNDYDSIWKVSVYYK